MDEVGGNKILLEDSGARIFLDFGKGFSRRAQFFEEYLKPRSANGLLDFVEMGLVPDIPGIYRDDLLEMAGRRAGPPDVDAVLVSHAHADHVDYISFLHRDIPVYMGATCHGILKAIQERAPRDFEREVLDFVPRPSKRGAKPVTRKIETFRSGRKFKVGSLEIHPIHVDHSIPGAYGFIIHTSSGAVVYTGDIRLHGARPEMTREFVQEAKASKPVAMICEGTRIADEFHEESEAYGELLLAQRTLTDDEASAFLRVLNEARLALGARLGVQVEGDHDLLPEDSRQVMDYLGWILEELTDELTRSL